MGRRVKQALKRRSKAHRIQVLRLRKRKNRMRGAAKRRKGRAGRRTRAKK